MIRKEIATEFAANEAQFTVEAYASTRDRDLVGDVVAEGAFRKSISERGDKIAVLWQHDPRIPVGKAIQLAEDSRGLRTVTQFNRDTDWGRNAFHAIKAGDVTGVSIGFDLVPGMHGVEPVDGKATRVIREVKLWEYSFVTFPANEEARVTSAKAFRALPEALWTIRGLQRAIADDDFPLTHEERILAEQLLADLPKAEKELRALVQPLDDDWPSYPAVVDRSTCESPSDATAPEVTRGLKELVAAMQFHLIRQEIQHGR